MLKIPYYDNPGGFLSVTVKIRYQSNIFVVDEQNYRSYKSGKSFGYHGGFFDKSPVKITVQGAGRWYLIVEDGSGGSYQYHWS
ncbi:DUF1883 domain-containing protein [Lactococcus lactis]|uniref:DUF1883 domain-containing protein n=1 Tax=Lactococcus lactis TaxID=1358 RepID=A0AAP3Z3D9_9LACT|nr:DUF1883 domain-containing protein [Lactococcus lactis]MDG4977604.1 DUF1883 domain-containing protein [Lactococcus lactis]